MTAITDTGFSLIYAPSIVRAPATTGSVQASSIAYDANNTIAEQIVRINTGGVITNGKIFASVASNNLTWGVHTLAGADPSSADPVYINIDNVQHTITAALSKTISAGSSFGNAGSAENATHELDWFVYAVYVTAAPGVRMFMSRLPYIRKFGDWIGGGNADNGYVGDNTSVVSTDPCQVIGRFGATLSAGASYNWSVPTFDSSNLVTGDIRYTRELTFSGFAYGDSGSKGSYAQDEECLTYTINANQLFLRQGARITNKGSWSGSFSTITPMTAKTFNNNNVYTPGAVVASGGNPFTGGRGGAKLTSATNAHGWIKAIDSAALQWSDVATNDSYWVIGYYTV